MRVTRSAGLSSLVLLVALLGAGCGKKMPDLVKKPYAEALASLDTAHFVITRADTLADTATFARRTIVSQSIAPKSKLNSKSNELRLTLQKNFAVVPDLIGSDPLKAVQQLGAVGLDFSPPQTEYTTTHTPDEGKVVRSDPVKGTVVDSGTKVTFAVRTFGRPCMGLRCLMVLDTAAIRRAYEKTRRIP